MRFSEMPGLAEAREAFHEVQTSEDLVGALESAVDTLGFSHYVYYRMRPRVEESGVKLSNYPDNWIEHYDKQSYQNVDPIFPASSQSIEPFVWSSLKATYAEDRGVVKFLGEAADFGLVDGVSVPVHGPNNSLDILSLCSSSTTKLALSSNAERLEACWTIGFLARRAYEICLPGSRTAPVHLTPREKEVLQWTAHGKTAWEIGKILEISDQTVVFHIKNASRKFGAYSKQQAVVKAILQGLIQP